MKCKLVLFFAILFLVPGLAMADPVFYLNPNLSTLTDQYGGDSGTFTRASDATYQANANGNLVGASTDVHRFETLSGLKYLLMEGAGTNLVTYSDDLDSWNSKQRCTIVSVTGIDGTSGNHGIVGNTDDNSHRIILSGISVTKADSSFTFWLKPGDKTWAYLIVAHDDALLNYLDESHVYLDIANEVCDSDYKIQSCTATGRTSNGYKEFVIKIASTDWHIDTEKIQIYIAPADSSGDYQFVGDDVTVNLHADGIQFEESIFPTSYVETSGTAASRTADALTWTTTAAQSASLADELTIIAEWTPSWDVTDEAGTYQLLSSTDGASLLYAVSDGTNGTITVTDGTNTATVALDWAAGTKYLIGIRAGSSEIQVGYSDDNGSSWSFGAADTFDGAFTDGGLLYLANDVANPMRIGRIAWWNTDLGTSGVEGFSWPDRPKGKIFIFD